MRRAYVVVYKAVQSGLFSLDASLKRKILIDCCPVFLSCSACYPIIILNHQILLYTTNVHGMRAYTGWTIDYMKATEVSTKIAAVHTKPCMYDIELSLT